MQLPMPRILRVQRLAVYEISDSRHCCGERGGAIYSIEKPSVN